MVAVLWGPLALWAGIDEAPRWGAREWAVLTASAVLHRAYFQVLLTGHRRADLTVVYPVARGSGPLLTALVAVAVLGERMNMLGVGGLVLVVLGIFVLAGGGQRAGGDRTRTQAGIAWGAATGVLIAGYSVVDGYAVKWLAMSPILVDWFGNVLRIPFMLPVALRDRGGFVQALRSQWKAALIVAVLGPLAYVLVLYAVRMAPLSHVAPAREVSMLVAALLGGRLLGEGQRGLRLAGAAAIALGVVGLAWGG